MKSTYLICHLFEKGICENEAQNQYGLIEGNGLRYSHWFKIK